ncbi:hypothetical protein Tco_0319405 [Tanacetum coccineum]
MGDENPIRTLGDYSKPSHEGYRNTIKLLVGKNVQDPSPHGRILLPDSLPILSTGKDRKTPQRYPNVPTTSWRISIRSMDSFQGLTPKSPTPQPQALETTFEVRELTTSKTPKKILIREEAKSPVTKNVNSISLARGEEERSDKMNETLGNTVKPTGIETGIPVKEAEGNNETENKPIEKAEKEEVVEAPSSRPVKYYLKHRINEKLIEGLVDNLRGPANDAILKKKITKKEDIRGNFEIPCSIRGLKNVKALVDQGSDVNIKPYSTYMKLTDERPAETDIRLSLASHSYIYPLGIC